MRNPLDHVSSDFWEVTRDFDKLCMMVPKEPGPGQATSPITGQLLAVRELDLKRIRDTANMSWSSDLFPGNIKSVADQSIQKINDTREFIAKGWEGRDFIAFSDQLSTLSKAIDKVRGPAEDMSKALKDLASAFEQALSDTITTISGLGGIISAIATVAVAAAAIPEPTVSKVVALIAAIITAILSAVGFVTGIIKGAETRQKAVNTTIQECTELVGALKSN